MQNNREIYELDNPAISSVQVIGSHAKPPHRPALKKKTSKPVKAKSKKRVTWGDGYVCDETPTKDASACAKNSKLDALKKCIMSAATEKGEDYVLDGLRQYVKCLGPVFVTRSGGLRQKLIDLGKASGDLVKIELLQRDAIQALDSILVDFINSTKKLDTSHTFLGALKNLEVDLQTVVDDTKTGLAQQKSEKSIRDAFLVGIKQMGDIILSPERQKAVELCTLQKIVDCFLKVFNLAIKWINKNTRWSVKPKTLYSEQRDEAKLMVKKFEDKLNDLKQAAEETPQTGGKLGG